MPLINFGNTPVGVASGSVYLNPGGTSTIAAGSLPGLAMPPIFSIEWNEETVATETIGNNAVQSVISVPTKAMLKITVDAKLIPEFYALIRGNTLTITGTTPTRTTRQATVAGKFAPVIAMDIYALAFDGGDLHYGFYNGVVTKFPKRKSEAYKPGTKVDIEVQVFACTTDGTLVIDAGHEAPTANDPTAQPKLP